MLPLPYNGKMKPLPLNCFRSSFDARGNSLFFFKSVLDINDTNSPFAFTIGSLPDRGI